MRKLVSFVVWFVLMSSSIFADDISIDSSGNLSIGTSNSIGNLKVVGASAEHGIAGEAVGTGAAGVYGIHTGTNNYGLLGNDQYGVYGNSSSGYAGYFQGDVKITGNLSIDGNWTDEIDPTVNVSVKDGVDWTELTGIPSGFADGVDNTVSSNIWTQNGSDIYYNSGNVLIGANLNVDGVITITGAITSNAANGSHYINASNSTDQSNPGDGDISYNTTSNVLNLYDGSSNVSVVQRKVGTTSPVANCTVGEPDIIDTDAGTNGVLYICTATNNWEAIDLTETDTIQVEFDGGGSEIADNSKHRVKIPWEAYITEAFASCDLSGSIVVDLWSDTHAAMLSGTLDSSDIITSSTPITVSNALGSSDSTLTSWSRTIVKNNWLFFNVTSATTVTRCTVGIMVNKVR